MTKPEPVLLDVDGAVATIRLNRPEARNALDDGLLEGLARSLDRVLAAKDARAVVLRGEGPAFCAGADIQWMRSQGERSPHENALSARQLAEVFERIDTLPVPVIARVHGAAMGGGVGLVLASDIVITTRDCRFALPEVRLGILPALVAPYATARIGTARARDAVLTGRTFGGDEAYAWGLATRLVSPEALDAEVERAAGEVLKGGPEAVRRAKVLLREVHGRRPEEVRGYTVAEIAEARAGEEGQEGLRAFLERRPPRWARRAGSADETEGAAE